MSKTFTEAFDVKIDQYVPDIVDDYDAFPNKVLLEQLRNEIIQNLIDETLENKDSLSDFIKTQVDKTVEGYDLSASERSYIYNLIDNEINGYGPLTELLKDKNIT